jgi:hypothetical protein
MTSDVPAFTTTRTTHPALEDILTLQDHVTANAAKNNASNEAREALLNAITKEVSKIDQTDAQSYRTTHLKDLAQAYALVVHGKD